MKPRRHTAYRLLNLGRQIADSVWRPASCGLLHQKARTLLRILLVACFAAPAVGIPTGRLAAQDAAGDQGQATFLFAGMTAEREKLRSGIFRGQGLRQHHFSAGMHEAEWSVFCAFDQGGDFFRFDQFLSLPRATSLPEDSLPSMKDLLDRDAMKFVRTTDRKLFWYARDQSVSIQTLDWKPDSPLKAFDVFALGLTNPISMDEGRSHETMVENYLSRSDAAVERLANGVTTISYIVLEGELRETLWIDEKRGYAPFRKELRINLPDFPRSAPFPDTKHYEQEVEVGWDNRGGTWVPVSVSAKTKTITLELTFDWESVNQPVPAKLFTPEGLGVPDHTLMIDHRLGEAIVLGNMQGPLPKRATLEDPAVGRRWWLIGINTLLVVGAALIAWHLVRRRKAAQR